MPRNMHFSPVRATSIDLCTHELLLHSVHLPRTLLIVGREDAYLPGIQVAPFDQKTSGLRKLFQINRIVQTFDPDVIVVHQYLKAAFFLSMLNAKKPVILHRHNVIKEKHRRLSRMIYDLYWSKIDHIFFVSEFCRSGQPDRRSYFSHQTSVLYNGLDVTRWKPAMQRTRTIMFAGRAHPDKGVAEAAKAAVAVLPDHPDWRAVFYLSQVAMNPDYASHVRQVLAPLGRRAEIVADAPFEAADGGRGDS